MSGPFSHVVLLAGGVGGARMAEGLKLALPADALTVIANVGDDEQFHGLHVSPDIDTILYTLSGRIDRDQGWGVDGDTVKALSTLGVLGAPVWMKLGDADFGLHIWRSHRLAQGATLTEITLEAAGRFGAGARILPATDDALRTRLLTPDGWSDFQAWFVGARCAPAVRAIEYGGWEDATATRDVLDALAQADAIVFAPSNPLLSIEPILSVPGLREAVRSAAAVRVGVSPLIGGKAVKGPLARLMSDLGMGVGAAGVAARYAGLLDGFVVDASDDADIEGLRSSGIGASGTDILMPTPARAAALAAHVLDFAARLRDR